MNQDGPNIPILGIPKMRQYELQIPKNCTAEQLGIFLQGFVKSLGMGFAFTDDDFSQISKDTSLVCTRRGTKWHRRTKQPC